MGRLSMLPQVAAAVKRNQPQIAESLHDPDISIRRRALDLLYGMCDAKNAQGVVHELLDYLIVSDFAIREELVLKIAILAEKYAPTQRWYVDVVLAIMDKAGDFVSDDIWCVVAPARCQRRTAAADAPAARAQAPRGADCDQRERPAGVRGGAGAHQAPRWQRARKHAQDCRRVRPHSPAVQPHPADWHSQRRLPAGRVWAPAAHGPGRVLWPAAAALSRMQSAHKGAAAVRICKGARVRSGRAQRVREC